SYTVHQYAFPTRRSSDLIQYCLENEAEPEAGIISEVERYMANPGQALAYKIGQLKILELRHKAEKELGDKFKIGEFHNQVLETGDRKSTRLNSSHVKISY